MNIYIPFFKKYTFPSKKLPLTMMFMEDLALIVISGDDMKKYLQNQLTCDLNLLNEKNFIFSAHCDLFGKVISCLYIFHFLHGIALITRKSLLNEQVQVLKKYSIFSKINIEFDNKFLLIGIAGFHAEEYLKKLFNYIPNEKQSIVQDKELTVLYFNFPSPRYLLITTSKIFSFIKKEIGEYVLLNSNKQWSLLDIESNYPIIDFPNNNKFFPQSINIKNFNGVSFNKGCYIGQEAISRYEYLGKNKFMLYLLKGKSKYIPSIGEKLKVKIGKEWIQTGKILFSSRLYNDEIWIQAVLKKIENSNMIFRSCKDETSMFLINQ